MPQQKRLRSEDDASVDAARESAMNTMERRMAASTWDAKARLVQRLANFAARHDLPIDALTMAAFVEATAVSQQSKLTYAAALKTVATELLHVPTAPLTAYCSGLRKSGALLPESQATPATRLLLHEVIRRFPQTELPLLLMWKTASRWSDVEPLTRRSFCEVSKTSLTIDWKGGPKSHKADPHRPDRYVMIRGPSTARIFDLLRLLRPNQRVTLLTSRQLENCLKQFGLTAHSIKHGAALVLLQAVNAGRIRAETMSILLKHKVPSLTVAPVTLRYLQDPAGIARLFQLDVATALL